MKYAQERKDSNIEVTGLRPTGASNWNRISNGDYD